MSFFVGALIDISGVRSPRAEFIYVGRSSGDRKWKRRFKKHEANESTKV